MLTSAVLVGLLHAVLHYDDQRKDFYWPLSAAYNAESDPLLDRLHICRLYDHRRPRLLVHHSLPVQASILAVG